MIVEKKISKKRLAIYIIATLGMFAISAFFVYKNYNLTKSNDYIEYTSFPPPSEEAYSRNTEKNKIVKESQETKQSQEQEQKSIDDIIEQNKDLIDLSLLQKGKFQRLIDNNVQLRYFKFGKVDLFEKPVFLKATRISDVEEVEEE